MKSPLFKLGWAPALVLGFHIFATVTNLYTTFWWFDIPLHFLGGVAIALSSYYFLEYFSFHEKFQTQFAPLHFLIIISFTALAAVCWEFMEFSFDTFMRTSLQPGIVDTVKDLTIGLIGGSIAAIAALALRFKK